MPDEVYRRAAERIRVKYEKGMIEHGGIGMEKAGLPPLEWIKALQEEAIDTVFYCEILIMQLENDNGKKGDQQGS